VGKRYPFLWVEDAVHGRVRVSEVQFTTLQALPDEWTAIYEYRKEEPENGGLRLPPVVLKTLAKRRWAETDHRGPLLFARRTKLGSSVFLSGPKERLRRPDLRGIDVL
jgi:hypothetical protein